MKKITVSMFSALAMNTFVFAGGNITLVKPEVVTVESPGNLYVGLGYSASTINDFWVGEGTYDDKYEQDAVTFIGGYNFYQYIGIEGRYMMGNGNADITENGSPTTEDIDFSNIALYIKPMLPIDNYRVYGLVGYGKTAYTWPGFDEITASGIQYGAGFSYIYNKNLSLFFDYTVLAEDNGVQYINGYDVTDVDGKAITFGVTYQF